MDNFGGSAISARQYVDTEMMIPKMSDLHSL